MQDFDKEFSTGPSDHYNRDYLDSIARQTMQRNSGMYHFFHTPMIDVYDGGFVKEDDVYTYIGLENGFRISEE